MLDAVRAYSATADAHGRVSRRQQILEADEAIERAYADLDDTIRQRGELGLLGRPASQETLEKLPKTLDHAHTARARLGDGGESDVIVPDDIDKQVRELSGGLLLGAGQLRFARFGIGVGDLTGARTDSVERVGLAAVRHRR